MNNVYLLTGGNLGDRAENLQLATKHIEQYCGAIVNQSSFYETAAWGLQEQPDFYNQALLLQTTLNASNLLEILLRIEYNMGRVRNIKMGPRIIDIDILFFNREIINEPDLVIPHPRMQDRRFVLMPLAEIAANFIHPVFDKSIKELLTECTDNLNVYKIGEEE